MRSLIAVLLLLAGCAADSDRVNRIWSGCHGTPPVCVGETKAD